MQALLKTEAFLAESSPFHILCGVVTGLVGLLFVAAAWPFRSTIGGGWLLAWPLLLWLYFSIAVGLERVLRRHHERSDRFGRHAQYERACSQRRDDDSNERNSIREAVLEQRRKDEEWWIGMDPLHFEKEVAELFRRAGFVAETTKASRDEGVDIRLAADQHLGVVQCKHRRQPASQSVLRDLVGAMSHSGADFAVAASLAGFTQPAREWAWGKPVCLLDIHNLIAMAQGDFRSLSCVVDLADVSLGSRLSTNASG